MNEQWRARLGQFGIWRSGWQTTPAIAAGLEQMGYGALWLGGSPDGDLLLVDELLSATTTLVVGTSIVNIWKDDAGTVAESYRRIEDRYPGRFILGVGTGHPEATTDYSKPYDTISGYVDRLLSSGVPAGNIVLAALGPRVLRLARERTGGAIPYLVTPEHTRQARELLGSAPLLAPEHKAVLGSNLAVDRKLGRERVSNPYLGLVNYTSNLRRLGFTDADLKGTGSDRLVEELVALGGPDRVAARLNEHLEAGADHVCVQLLAEPDTDPMPGYEQLAIALSL